MTTKKIMGIVAMIIIGGIGLFIFVLYLTIKTKSTNIETSQPFKKWVEQTVTINREAVLFQEKIPLNHNSDYPYVLYDSLHPLWQYVNDQKKLAQPDLKQIAIIPPGTKLKLEKAIQYTNGVSGSSYPKIFGTITANGKTYKIGYQWGTMDIAKFFDKIEKCWQFHQAPWQDKPDTVFYALPTAKIW